MGAGKNKAHRKKRISKHVRQSQERIVEKGGEDVPGTAIDSVLPQPSEKKGSKSKKKKIEITKDPKEAASYLSTWKHRDAGVGVWKFNKNTQSWLIRHMYDAKNVPKAVFETLIEYLAAGGEGLRARVLKDATRRALRYKEYEASLESESRNGSSVNSKEVLAREDKRTETEEPKDEEELWKALSDHDKRKEYKRCRKIIDLLKDKK